MSRDNNPGERADWVSACTRSICDGDLEVTIKLYGVARRCGDAFQAGRDELTVSISNSAVAQVILQSINKLNVPDRATLLSNQSSYSVIPVCFPSYGPFGSQARTEPCLPLRVGL